MKRILIVSYYFYPENTPRAFRANELAKEFSRRGYNVDVVIPRNNYNYDKFKLKNKRINILMDEDGLYKDLVNSVAKKQDSNNSIKAKIKKPLKKYYHYIIGEKNLSNYKYYMNLLKKLQNGYDVLISVGLPFSVHLGVAKALEENKLLAKVNIADYGDPFYYNSMYKRMKYYKDIEKQVLEQFNYVSIPTENVIESYKCFKDIKNIKVIPQGVDFKEIKIDEYKKNIQPTFAYAGAFYEGIRHPGEFLEYLSKLKIDFKLHIYTDEYGQTFLEPFKEKLNGKIVINGLVDRSECIQRLSTMDFLINLSNVDSKQIPSKLIDYSLSKRPILNIIPNNINENTIQEFLQGNYDNQLKFDVNQFNIENVCNLYEELF